MSLYPESQKGINWTENGRARGTDKPLIGFLNGRLDAHGGKNISPLFLFLPRLISQRFNKQTGGRKKKGGGGNNNSHNEDQTEL